MTRNIDCPYCWTRFKENELLHRCGLACEKDARFFTAQEAAGKGQCPHGRRPLNRRFCKAESCHRPLLREYVENQGRTVAVIGMPDSGKTTYIGVLLHELRGRVSSRFNGMALDLLGDSSRENYDKRFAGPLFDQGRAVRKTVVLRDGDALDPLIFTLRIPGASRFSANRSLLSVFYDTSGENILNADHMDVLVRYLETARGVVLLIDPLQTRRVRERFGQSLPSLPANLEGDQVQVVQRLAETLRERKQGRSKGKLSVPLAIVITKIDMLRDSFDPASPLRRAADHDGYYDERDGQDVHEELRAWLGQWFGPGFDNTVAGSFADYRYFGVTSLGEPPLDEKRISPSGIHPYRVEDPMLWLLARFGAIKSVRGKA